MLKKIILPIGIILLSSLLFFFGVKNQIKSSDTAHQLNQNTYRIGFITDIHGKASSKRKGDLTIETKKTLLAFQDQMQIFRPNFVMDGGDLIEGTDREGQQSIDDFKKLSLYFKNLKVPVYHVIGNHETRGFSKETWLELVNYTQPYYFFDFGNLRVIVMDGNENEKVATTTVGYDKDFYYLSEEQLAWLEKTLTERNDLKKIVFLHYPPLETPGTKMIDLAQSERLRQIFSQNKVLAVFSGHAEILNYQDIGGVRYFTLPGIEKSQAKEIAWLESFAEIAVAENATVKLYYKKERSGDYKILSLPSAEYDQIAK